MYCNADLKRYYTNIDEFDLKKTLMDEWVNISDNIWRYYDSGSVSRLYKDGEDLGDPQASEVAVNSNDEWFYDSTNDYIVMKIEGTAVIEEMQVAPMDWPSAKVAAIADGAEWLEGLLDVRFPRPLPKNANGNYDYIIERINGLLACIILIRTSNPEASEIDAIWRELYNDTETGLLQLLNSGKIKLGFEVTQSDKGAIEVGALDATTTGELTDPQGTATLDYEKFKVEIVTGGTLTTGTKNETVTYKVTDSQGSEVNSVDYITGYYQPIGGGIEARFTPGVYVADDYWFVTVTAVPSSTQTIKSIKVSR